MSENVTEPTGSPYDAEIAALEANEARTHAENRRLNELLEADEVWRAAQGQDVYGDRLLAVAVDGTIRWIENSFPAIKEAIDGATLDVVTLDDDVTLFVDDNGLANGLQLNWAASIFCHQVLFGPVVLCGGADEEGNTRRASPEMARVLEIFAASAVALYRSAERVGQSITIHADPSTVPPPTILAITSPEELMRVLGLRVEGE